MCEWVASAGKLTCIECGYETSAPCDRIEGCAAECINTVEQINGTTLVLRQATPTTPHYLLFTAKERRKLFGNETDATLIGNRLSALAAAIGIPECDNCKKRKAWLNKAHKWLRKTLGTDND